MRRILSPALVAGLVLAGLALLSAGQAEKPVGVDKLNKKIDGLNLKDAAGKAVTLATLKDNKAVVVVFLSFDCPVSNSYSPLLAELHKRYAGKGVAFLGINASDDLSAAEVAKKAGEYSLPFPVHKDDGHKAADQLQARTAPEAFVLDHNRVLRYRGRIDNKYAARLRPNTQTTQHDLRDALDDVLAGKSVRTPATTAIGCPIQRDRVARKDGKVTYHRDVLPILQNHCQECHRPGQVGPFALMTYKHAVNWAEDIKEYTRERKMPPWKPVESVAFHNERKLTAQEIATLAAWVDGGTPEGDPKDAPRPRTFTDGWQLGTPDLVLTVPSDMTLAASGKDLFRCFVLPTGLTEDKHVVAVEVRPSNKRVVHHTLNFFDTTGRARELEKKEAQRAKKAGEKDTGPGYSVAMGIGFTPGSGRTGGLGGWAPGQRARQLPEGYGYRLPKNSDVVLQVHYHRNGRVETDRTSIGLYFARKPDVKPFKSVIIPGVFLAIPANVANYKVKGSVEVLADGELHSVMPHMHMLGKQIQVTMTPPGGKAQTLVKINDWDYNWQETYFLKERIAFKKGTKFAVEAVYDNSDKNPNNPFSPPRWVRFGEQTDNEMCFVFLGVTGVSSGRFPFRPEGLGGLRLRPQEKKEDRKP